MNKFTIQDWIDAHGAGLGITNAEYVRRCCRGDIEKDGKVCRLPDGWTSTKEGHSWFITRSIDNSPPNKEQSAGLAAIFDDNLRARRDFPFGLQVDLLVGIAWQLGRHSAPAPVELAKLFADVSSALQTLGRPDARLIYGLMDLQCYRNTAKGDDKQFEKLLNCRSQPISKLMWEITNPSTIEDLVKVCRQADQFQKSIKRDNRQTDLAARSLVRAIKARFISHGQPVSDKANSTFYEVANSALRYVKSEQQPRNIASAKRNQSDKDHKRIIQEVVREDNQSSKVTPTEQIKRRKKS